MWLLSWLPDWIFHLITIAGALGIVVSFVLGFIPFVSQYKLPIQVLSIIALVFGIWFEGAISNEAVWQERVNQLQAEIAKKEVESAKVNLQIQTKYIEKIKVVKDVQIKIKEVIKENQSIIDAECKVVPEVIEILNSAALNDIGTEQ